MQSNLTGQKKVEATQSKNYAILKNLLYRKIRNLAAHLSASPRYPQVFLHFFVISSNNVDITRQQIIHRFFHFQIINLKNGLTWPLKQ